MLDNEEGEETTDRSPKNCPFGQMFDEQAGLIVNQVSTSMIDLEDILYNK